jgi:transcriptional regulator with XRE-family HTH domain
MIGAGQVLGDARRRHGISQARLARRAGTSQAAISEIERGVVVPSWDTLAGLLLCLGEALPPGAVALEGTVDDDALRRFRARSMSDRLADALAFSAFAAGLHGRARER